MYVCLCLGATRAFYYSLQTDANPIKVQASHTAAPHRPALRVREHIYTFTNTHARGYGFKLYLFFIFLRLQL
jgi:hypothetical protein